MSNCLFYRWYLVPIGVSKASKREKSWHVNSEGQIEEEEKEYGYFIDFHVLYIIFRLSEVWEISGERRRRSLSNYAVSWFLIIWGAIVMLYSWGPSVDENGNLLSVPMKLEMEIKDDCSKWQLRDRVYDLMTSYRIEFIVGFHFRFVNFDNEHEKRKTFPTYVYVRFSFKAIVCISVGRTIVWNWDYFGWWNSVHPGRS